MLILFSIEGRGERREIEEKERKKKRERSKRSTELRRTQTEDVKRRRESWESMDTMEREGERNRKEEQAKD